MGRKSNSVNHGLSKTRIFSSWIHMRFRCADKKLKHYHRYGGRGITVCKEWQDDFLAFYKDMGNPPTEKHSIDRIDNNKGYFKENCRWVTQSKQLSNQNRTKLLTYLGRTQSLKEWVTELNLDEERTRSRIKRGWRVERAFEMPIVPKEHRDGRGRFIAS